MNLSRFPVVPQAYGTLPQRPQLDQKIASVPTQVSAAVTCVADWLTQEGIAGECIGDFTLVLAEALNNVIEHAYGSRPDGAIEIRAVMRPTTLSVQIIDEGTPFDGPPDAVMVEPDAQDVSDLPEGGYGWFLINSLTEDIHFAHDDGRNKLTLVVALRAAED